MHDSCAARYLSSPSARSPPPPAVSFLLRRHRHTYTHTPTPTHTCTHTLHSQPVAKTKFPDPLTIYSSKTPFQLQPGPATQLPGPSRNFVSTANASPDHARCVYSWWERRARCCPAAQSHRIRDPETPRLRTPTLQTPPRITGLCLVQRPSAAGDQAMHLDFHRSFLQGGDRHWRRICRETVHEPHITLSVWECEDMGGASMRTLPARKTANQESLSSFLLFIRKLGATGLMSDRRPNLQPGREPLPLAPKIPCLPLLQKPDIEHLFP